MRSAFRIAFLLVLATQLVSAAVTGRYVYYSNPLSAYLALAEFEVWSGDRNLTAGRPECFTQDYLYKSYRWGVRELVDGKKDPEGRHVELTGAGTSTYSDTSAGYPAFEVDLGESLPIDHIDIYRSRYTTRGPQDLGWRLLLVLDEERRIVAWNTFNVFAKPHPQNQGIWVFTPEPAAGVPAGMVVPPRSRSWLSEAEYLRDFLGKPVDDRTGDLSAIQQERLARFQRRNDPEEIARLGREFFRTVQLDRPQLAPVRKLVEQGDYAAALEAFKAPFFATIGQVAGQASFEYSWGYDADSRDIMRARDLANHVYGDKEALTVTRFQPGLMPPAPFKYPFQMRPLLVAYSGTGDAALLRQWEEMTDDWALGFQDAADADPDLRQHFVLIGGEIRRNLQDLAETARSRPEFVDELSGATLARFMMPIAEETPVAMWRVWRTVVFNHSFNATGGAYQIAGLLADFRAGTRLEREFRQQTMRLYTLSQYRDGPMVEVCDEGHFIFNYLAIATLYGQLCIDRPAWFTPGREAFMLDHLRQAELVAVRHTSPGGVGSRWAWRRDGCYPSLREGRFNPEPDMLDRGEPVEADRLCSFLQRASVMAEYQSRAVADTVYGYGAALGKLDAPEVRELRLREIGARYHALPEVVSDWMPYVGCYYFRGGWERDASLLHMFKPPIANSTDGGNNNTYSRTWERFNDTSYRFQDYATALLTNFATEIDHQMPCPQYGRYPSGSKQDVFAQAVEKPQPRRWYTDDALDFGEAEFTGIYHNIYRSGQEVNGKWTVSYADDPVTIHDVRTTRQIFQVRPARLFLHVERVDYADAGETHTNRIPTDLILTEPAPDTGKEFSDDQLRLDDGKKTIAARNPGNPGVTLAWFGQPALTFTRFTINGTEARFWPKPIEEAVDPAKDATLYEDPWGNGYQTLNGPRRTTGRGILSSWPATGSSVLVGALYANAPGDEPIRQLDDISTDTVAGVCAKTAKGAVVTLQVARRIPAALRIGAVAAQAEALLVVEVPRQPTRVMVLGATRLSIADHETPVLPMDVVFDLVDGHTLANRQPIRRPQDPPTVGPAVNVFTDRTTVTLTTESADAVIRYTTATPKSRMAEFRAEAARLLAGNSTLSESAERLALRDLDGADWQVYTGPFTISEDTVVRARTFRQGVGVVPMLRAAGDDVSVVSYGFFVKQPTKPARWRLFKNLQAGLAYEYLEGRWSALWTYADVLPATATGTAGLLDVSMRATDEPFAVRYRGYLDVPATGVYSFYGPHEFVNKVGAPGYDLRVYVDGEEWDLTQTWHGRGQWSVPLEKGLHAFLVTFADARAKDLEHQRVDLWRGYPEPRTTWRGVAPVLEVSGPGIERQPVPAAWLKH